MSEREKKLAVVFGAVFVVIVVARFVYPSWVRPMFDYGAQLSKAEVALHEAQAEHDKVEGTLRQRYHEFIVRTGGTDPSEVRDDLYERILALIRASKLKSPQVSPRKPSTDRKTNIATLGYSVSAKGSFEQCVDFIERFYRIPYLARINSLQLTPTEALQRADHDEVKLDAEIEVLVLPFEKRFGAPKDEQPAETLKLATIDFSQLKGWKPFTPYREQPPPTPAPTPPPERFVERPTRPPPPSGPPVSPDASQLALRMVNRYGVGEVLLEDVSDHTTQRVEVGGSLDAGTLVLVHGYGAVVRKEWEPDKSGYFVYPLGEPLSHAVALEDAHDLPQIQVEMMWYLQDADKPGAPTEEMPNAAAAVVGAGTELTEFVDLTTTGVLQLDEPPFLERPLDREPATRPSSASPVPASKPALQARDSATTRRPKIAANESTRPRVLSPVQRHGPAMLRKDAAGEATSQPADGPTPVVRDVRRSFPARLGEPIRIDESDQE